MRIVAAQFALTVSFAIFTSASLSFLGLGIPPPTPDWGSMVRSGFDFLAINPTMSLAPGGRGRGHSCSASICWETRGEMTQAPRQPEPILRGRGPERALHGARGGAVQAAQRRLVRPRIAARRWRSSASSGSRQVDHRPRHHGAGRSRARRQRLRRGSISSRKDGTRQDISRSSTTAALREVRGNDVAMIFQEPMSSLNPVYTIGAQITEALRQHQRARRRARRAREARDLLAELGIADPRAVPRELSAPALRRHAPARDDRDRAVRQPAAS